jgi:hypothetical protein
MLGFYNVPVVLGKCRYNRGIILRGGFTAVRVAYNGGVEVWSWFLDY